MLQSMGSQKVWKKTEQPNNWQWPEFYHCFGHERAALPRKLDKQDLSQWLEDSPQKLGCVP